MSREIFKSEVRMLSIPKDYEDNNDLLDTVKKHQYESVKGLLKRGGEIQPSIQALDHIDLLARSTNLSQMNIVELINGFRKLSFFIDIKNY